MRIAPAEAENFVREMSMLGFDVETEKMGNGDRHDYRFERNGRIHQGHTVTIDYASDQAWLVIRPE